MGNYYNTAGDLLITARACMKQGKTKRALECAELALQTPDIEDIIIGLKQLNTVAADEIEEDEDIEIDESCGDKCDPEAEEDEDIELEVEESSDDEDEEVEVEEDEEESEEDEDIEDACGKECASADDDEDDEEDDEEVEVEEDEEEIDEAKLDEVLCQLRKKYNVTSSIVKPASTLSSKLKALASKASK